MDEVQRKLNSPILKLFRLPKRSKIKLLNDSLVPSGGDIIETEAFTFVAKYWSKPDKI